MGKLSSYTVDRDYGFAPNPFWKCCTLATCKPNIRGHAEIGDYVIGFGGIRTKKKEKVIFIMKVEEILTFNQYWNDERFQIKKPNVFGSLKTQYGDNIYHQELDGEWIQESGHHSTEILLPNPKNVKNDTKYDNVLVSFKEWWYFGDKAIDLPTSLHKFIHKRNHKNFIDESDYSVLVDWISNQYPSRGRYGLPNEWIKISSDITNE